MGKTLGERIAQGRRVLGVREWQDISQKQLADRVGVKDATVSRWEGNLITPGEPTLKVLAQELGVRLDWLIAGEGPMLRDAPQLAQNAPETAKTPKAIRRPAGKGVGRQAGRGKGGDAKRRGA